VKLNLYSIAYPVTSLGPGYRLVIWVAGCKKRCPGCISPEMLDAKAGKHIETARLLRHFLRLNCTIDGITISGGEPFDQPEPLAELLEGLSDHRPDWNVMVYTGYRLSELSRISFTLNLLSKIDVLIDGEYRRDISSDHPLIGSGNQKLHFLTERGLAMKDQIDLLPQNNANLGIGYDRDMLIGVLNPDARKDIHKMLGVKGDLNIDFT
jgi:anaerobic ribonucleoside-triphosphate reductase activating protein